jgi:hypothetical protein
MVGCGERGKRHLIVTRDPIQRLTVRDYDIARFVLY